MYIKNIGTDKAYNVQRDFEAKLTEKAQKSMNDIKVHITSLDQNDEMKILEGGCQFLLSWYHEQCNI